MQSTLWQNLSSKTLTSTGKRNLFYWLVVVFNSVDHERKKQFGADRVCAEWILRNGGSIKYLGASKFLSNYNLLPTERSSLKIKEIDATDSSISHHGFPHFDGCEHIDKLILNNCTYVGDRALKELHYLTNSLHELQVSSCKSISQDGLSSLSTLVNLQQLKLYDLPSVDNMEEVVQKLKASLSKCNITIN